ncbi:MAG: hypothetical protein ACOCZU_03585 [Planctomycetota bacterium]
MDVDAPRGLLRAFAELEDPRMDRTKYFLLNDGSATPALLQVWDASYADGVDAVTGEPIDVSGTLAIDLPARSGRWIRFSAK